MIFEEVRPCPPLQHLVKNYLLANLNHESIYLPVTPYPARIEQALIFFARGYIESFNPITGQRMRIANSALFCQQTSRLTFQSVAPQDFLMLAVVFKPGAMYRLLGLPLHELTCQFCDAESVIATELHNVNDAVANCIKYAGMIARVEEYLLDKVRSIKIDAHPIDMIGNLLLENPTSFSLDWLARQSNLSPRQFERKFNERIGIGPKLYSRISRFFKAFQYKEAHPEMDWLTVAIQFGYSDYNHMAKDFKQFANVTPNIMIHEYAKRPEAVLLNL